MLSLGLGRPIFDGQLILHFENVGHASGVGFRKLAIHIIQDHSLQRNAAAFHDDVNWRNGAVNRT